MADVPVGAVPAPATPAAKPTMASAAAAAVSAKAAKIAAVTAGLAKMASETNEPPPAEPAAKPAQQLADEAKAPEPKVEERPVEIEPKEAKADDAVDEKTAKALAAIDKQAKRFRDEQTAAKAELAQERAEIARIKAELTAKPAESIDDLRALAKRNPIAALEKLGLESEDEWENVGRGAFPRTKTGKADPRARDQVNQTTAQRETMARIEAVEKQNADLLEQLKTREASAQTEQMHAKFADGAAKAIPTDPSLIGKLHAKAPEKAKATLLSLAIHMEREATKADGGKFDPSHTPSYADVIAKYEELRRAELEEQGVDVDAMLKPAKITAAAAPISKTLDPSQTGGTRSVNGNPSKSERLMKVSKGLSDMWKETT